MHSGHVSWVTFSPKEQGGRYLQSSDPRTLGKDHPTRRFISPNQLVFIRMELSGFYVTWICSQLGLQSHLRSSAGLPSGREGSYLKAQVVSLSTERAACKLQFVSSIFTWVTQSPCTFQRVYSAFGEAAALWMAMLGMSSTLGIFFQVLRTRIEGSPSYTLSSARSLASGESFSWRLHLPPSLSILPALSTLSVGSSLNGPYPLSTSFSRVQGKKSQCVTVTNNMVFFFF